MAMINSRVSLIDASFADPGLAGERARARTRDGLAPAAFARPAFDGALHAAPGPSPIAIVALTPAEGFVIQGDADGDQAGRSVSDAGDINGDGFADIIVGAPAGDDGGADAGEAYVIFGKAGGFGTIDLASLAPADGFAMRGDTSTDLAGYSVATAGDFNGDGFDDLIVGAPNCDNGGFNAGEAYVIFGKAAGFADIDLTNLAPAGFIILNDDNEYQVGFSVASAGDINGDGFDDVIVGARGASGGGTNAGEAYVIFGKAAGFANIDVGALAPADGFTIQGDADFDNAGWSVSSAGDINNDGFDEIIVGASQGDDGGTDAGEAYVLFGKAGGFADIDLASLAAADGFVIQGFGAGGMAGLSVSSAGDVDGDGFADIIIGAPFSDANGADAGQAFVLYGMANGFGAINLGTIGSFSVAGFAIFAEGAADQLGFSVSSAGDVNGDGYDDMILGAPGNDDGGAGAGEAYVVYGGERDLDGDNRIFIGALGLFDGRFGDGFAIGGEAGHTFGRSVSTAGDVNGDGLADIIVGAPTGDDGGADAGQAYVIFGVAPTEGVDRVGTVASQNLVGGDSDDTLDGRDGDDRLFGNGGDDLLKGGAGDDEARGGDESDNLSGGSGDDSLQGDEGGDTLSGGSGADDLSGDEGDDSLDGGDATDSLTGGGGSDKLFGGSGKDTMRGGTGVDTMTGGSGNDRYYVDDAGDLAIEGPAGGKDVVFASVDYDAGDNEIERIAARSASGVMLAASDYATRLDGDVGNDTLIGGGSADTLRGRGGADSMAGGGGDDRYVVNDPGDLVVEAAAGGVDTVFASADFDAGGAEIEIIVARSAGGLALTAGDAAARLFGAGGMDTLTGGAGGDTLNGKGGDDRLVMTAGADSMTGGGGADVFVLTDDLAGADRASILDFTSGTDLIEVSAADFGGGLAPGALPGEAFAVNATGDAGDADDRFIYDSDSGRLFFDADGTGAGAALLIAKLDGAPPLTASDFIVV